MARPGITYLDVATAASQLQTNHEMPTIERVRQKLGTGSNTTIANHLKRWKAEAMPEVSTIQRSTLPPQLLTQIQGLWEHVKDSAGYQFEQKRLDYDDRLKSLEADNQQLRAELVKASTVNNKLQVKLTSVHKDLLTSQALVEQKDEVLTALKAELAQRQTRVDEKSQTIAVLKEQCQQLSENFEHLQEHTRQARDQESLKHAKAISLLQQELTALRATNASLQRDNQVLQSSQQQIKLEHSQLQSELELKVEEKKVRELSIDELTAKLNHVASDLKVLKQELKTQRATNQSQQQTIDTQKTTLDSLQINLAKHQEKVMYLNQRNLEQQKEAVLLKQENKALIGEISVLRDKLSRTQSIGKDTPD